MTEISDDRSWWADVEHLRPDADGSVATRPTSTPDRAFADGDHDRRPVRQRARRSGDAASDGDPHGRRGRITGRPLPEPVEPPAVLRRADVASFADAMDLDGAFGAPVRPAESREIVLSGRRGARVDQPADRMVPARPAVRGKGSPDRATVRITGNPGIHAELAERRALREIESRRPRSVADRAGHRPDRVAMWAVFLGLLLVVIAASSSSGVS